MARIISPVWSIIRGSIAGTTYLNGPGNSIIARQRARPTNPNTPYQMQSRATLQQMVLYWSNLSAANQALWNQYGQTVTVNSPTGSFTLSGRQAYIGGVGFAFRLKTYMGAAINVLTTTAPTDPGRYAFFSVVNAIPTGPALYGISVSVSNNSFKAIAVLIQASIPVNPARNYWKGPYSSTLSSVVLIAAPASIKVDIVPWGVGNVGKRVFWRVRAVTANAGGTIPHALTDCFTGNMLIQQGV